VKRVACFFWGSKDLAVRELKVTATAATSAVTSAVTSAGTSAATTQDCAPAVADAEVAAHPVISTLDPSFKTAAIEYCHSNKLPAFSIEAIVVRINHYFYISSPCFADDLACCPPF